MTNEQLTPEVLEKVALLRTTFLDIDRMAREYTFNRHKEALQALADQGADAVRKKAALDVMQMLMFAAGELVADKPEASAALLEAADVFERLSK